MRACARLLGPLLLPFLVACGGPPPPAPAEPASPQPGAEASPAPTPTPATPSAEPSPDAAKGVELRGTIVHRPVDSTRMSVESYLGDELFLTTEDGRELVLQPTEAHLSEAIAALAGKLVVIQAEETEGTLPDPREAYPTGPNGEPLRRGAGFRVLEIRPLDP
ncbi:MAG: hypothetical protein H6710_02590 [Myxococcales bacterium]|nr:hypothetical protein [Myxococcales bacterium]MCB9703956.1 hypothetical protein [Myxococcales bacterium]